MSKPVEIDIQAAAAQEGLPSQALPTAGGRSLQLVLIAIALLAANYARTAVGPLQETIRNALALSDNELALLQGPAQAVPVVLAAIPLGLLIDRYSRVRLIFVFAVLNILGSLLTASASNFAMLFAARCLVGLSAIATLTSSFSLVADLYKPSQRGRSIMVLEISQMGGHSAAFALGGALLVMYGTTGEAWRWPMYWVAGLLMAVALLALALKEPPRLGRVVVNPPIRVVWAELWQYRKMLVPLLIGKTLLQISLGAAYIWAVSALARNLGLSPDRTGGLMATALLTSGILGPVVGGPLADICQRTGGPRRTMWVVGVVATVGAPAGLFGVVPDVTWASVLLVAFFALGGAAILMGSTVFTVVMPNELRGLGMTLLFAVGTLAAFGVAPMAVSMLSGALGGPAMIGKAMAAVSATASLLAAAAFALGSRQFAGAKK